MNRRLIAQQFAADPRVAEAKRLLLDALTEHQAKLTGPRPADPALRQSYEATITQFSQMRGGALYFPYLGSGIGRGPLVELADGSVKYDFITGIGVHFFGHSHPALVSAALDAAIADTTMQGNLQQETHSAELVWLLLQGANQSGAALEHCYLTTSGAMANENALKVLFHRKAPATRVLAFRGCFAGRTLALAQVTDKARYRVGLPPTLSVDYVPFFDAADPQGSTERSLAVLREHLARYPGQHACMMFELVQGEAGFYPGSTPFFTAIMDALRAADVPIFIDEVQTFGRTSRLFAFQHFGLDRYVDVVTIGKLTQACATLIRGEFKPAPGLISQTFTASTSAIHVALAIVRELSSGDYYGPDGRIEQHHRHFVGRLADLAHRRPGWIRGPFGIGAMVAFTPFDGSAEVAKEVVLTLFDAGVIAFIAGDHPARVRFLVPVAAVTPQDIDAVCTILEEVLAKIARK